MNEVEKALQKLLEGDDPSPQDHFPPKVNARLREPPSWASKEPTESEKNRHDDAMRLLGAAQRASKTAQRITWLNKAADAFSASHASRAACKDRCDHCCHIPVKLSQAEAAFLGKAIGRAPTPASELSQTPWDQAPMSPCTFLEAGHCSVYVNRPAVCRTHMNMDRDDLLCRLVPGLDIPVPYADTRAFAFVSMHIAGEGEWADIRQWFPRAGSKAGVP